MKTKHILPLVLLSIAIAFYACNKDASSSSSTLGFQVQALNQTVALPTNGIYKAAVAGTSSTVTWDTANMVISQMRYEAEVRGVLQGIDTSRRWGHHHGFRDDSTKVVFNWTGPKTISLFDINTFLGNYTFNAGFYNEVELYIDGLKKDAGTGPVFYLSGLYTNAAGTKTRVMVPIMDNVMFKTEQDSITVAAGLVTDFTGVVQIYLDKLLTDISSTNLDNATLTNGNIVISPTSNTALYYIIRRNLFMDHGCHHERGMRHGH